MADLLEMKGEQRFKVVAYQKAARAIGHLSRDLREFAEEGELEQIPGIGKSIAAKIQELVETGQLRQYEELRAEMPEGVLRIANIPGIGPKSAYLICQELGVSTVEGLEKAILQGRLETLPRMGKKTGENILQHIHSFTSRDGRIPLGKALPIAEAVCASIRPYVKNVTAGGSLRRLEETVGDIDILGTSDDPKAALDAFINLPFITRVLAHGPTKAAGIVYDEVQVDFRIVEHDAYGDLLQHFTGSKEHNVLLRERARKMGLSVSEYGITDIATGNREQFATEEEVYARLGLPYIPPEIRWGLDEIDLAERGRLPALVEGTDIKGDLHCHSEWSDGRDPLEALADRAQEIGYPYLAITDHSYGRGIANGLSEERVLQQIETISRINGGFHNGFRLLTGTEVDIRADGSLDFSDEVLARLDVVVASLHSGLSQDRERITARVIKAMENPHVDIIGHLTGRLIGERPPVDFDMEEVLLAAKRTGTAMEINASPLRLDLKDTSVRRARELGIKLVISSDAHAASHLDGLRLGVGVARRGMCRTEDILNTRPVEDFLALLKNGGR